MTVLAGPGYLLDTNVSIWLDQEPEHLPDSLMAALQAPGNQLYISSVSFWEVAIKQALGKLTDRIRLASMLPLYGIEELAITSRYTTAVRELPRLHKDPFDRMLVAQAMVEGLVLVTSDRRLAEYGVKLLRV